MGRTPNPKGAEHSLPPLPRQELPLLPGQRLKPLLVDLVEDPVHLASPGPAHPALWAELLLITLVTFGDPDPECRSFSRTSSTGTAKIRQ